jgi:NAD(P)H dehydrogenase (quinone)
MPFDQNKIAFVSPEDIAYVAVKIFENPSEYQGETYTLYGPEQYSFEEAYQKISQVLNHKIKYEIVSVEAWADGLKDFLPPE